jgi:NAD(P)H dehydrogenase (quinone)
MTNLPTLLVSGAGGKLGRRVIELLLERGYAGRIVTGSRSPEKLAFAGVETRKIDFGDAATLATAFAGIDRLLLISTNQGRTRLAGHVAAVEAAAAAGVKHIVYTSAPAPEPGSAIPFAFEHYGTEEAIKRSGVGYTILRMHWYAENLLGSLPSSLATGIWHTSSGNGTISHVWREDCARAAAGALLGGDENRILTVTGPEALTNRDIAAIAGDVTGKSIEVVDVSDGELEAGYLQAGLPAALAALFVAFDINQRNGGVSTTTNVVEQLWGTKAQSLRAFLEANKPALVAAA